MNLEHVRTFLEVSATGSFGRAAEHLNVTQSTVSTRVQTLEESLDRVLFLRGRSGAALTAAGQQFQHYAETMYRAWQQARREVALPAGFGGILSIGVQVSLWERLILAWIPWLREQAPDIAVRVETDYSDSLMRRLSDGLLDVGIMYVPRTSAGLTVEKLLEEKLVLVSTTERSVRDDWVSDYVFVHWGEDFRAAHDEAFPDMQAPAIAVGLGAMGLQYILANGGSGYFPLRVVRSLLADGRLHRVARAPTFGRPAYMVYALEATDPERRDFALAGLRRIAAGESED
jgi:LysR family transcriptional regulator, flagellar master operon regulator